MHLDKKVKICELFEPKTPYLQPLFERAEYPWEILPRINGYIKELFENPPPGFIQVKPGVLAGKNVKISPLATVEPPAVLGDGTELRPGAYIRGNVITGANCTIGNSCELKNCVLLEHASVPHYNYVGDSVLGVGAHMGAGAICSNLKADGKDVVVHGEREYATGLRKVGAVLGDGAEVGCGCVLNPGTVVGKRTRVYPLTSLRGVTGEDMIVKSDGNSVKRRAEK